jgi:hypothetical protein
LGKTSQNLFTATFFKRKVMRDLKRVKGKREGKFEKKK